MWSVVTSGALVTSWFDEANSQNFPLNVLSITGTRTYTNASGSYASTITGLAPLLASGCNNSNIVNRRWPQLSNYPGGIAYYIDPPVALPTTDAPTPLIGLYNQPPIEWGVPPTSTGVSYFVYQAGNTLPALQCPLPVAVSYAFHYISIPLTMYMPPFMTCMTGTMSVIGPFALGNDLTGLISPTYIMTDATGYRVFTNVTAGGTGGVVNTQRIINVGQDDGGDSVFYTAYPWFDDAGLTFELESPAIVSRGNDVGSKWINLWREDSYPSEAADYPGNPDNYIDWRYEPLDASANSSAAAFVCPTVVDFPVWSFCRYSESAAGQSGWSVTESGQMWSTYLSPAGQYYVGALRGQRVQTDPVGVRYNTSIVQLLQLNASYPSAIDCSDPTNVTLQERAFGGFCGSYQQFPAVHNDNLLGTQYPYLSPNGLFYQLADPVTLPGTSVEAAYVGVHSTPPVDALNATFNSEAVTGFSYFAYQLASLGPMPCGDSAPTTTFAFHYQALAADASFGAWSVCASGTLTAVGPFFLPAADGGTSPTYFVKAATGSRVLLDEVGAATIQAIVAVSRGGGGDFSIYANNSAAAVDAGGLTLELNGMAAFAGGVVSNGSWVNVFAQSDGTISERGAVPGAANAGSFSFAPLSASWSLPTCVVPSATLSLLQDGASQGGSGLSGRGSAALVLAAAVTIIGCVVALMSVERAVHELKSRRDPRWLLWLVLAAAALGGGGFWAALLAEYSALSVPCASCIAPIELRFSLQVALLALLPALLPVFLGLLLLTVTWRPAGLGRVASISGASTTTRPSNASHTGTTGVSSKLSKASRRSESAGIAVVVDRSASGVFGSVVRRLGYVAADLSLTARVVLANLNWSVLLASALVTLSLVLTRAVLLFAVTGDVELTPSAAASALSSLLVWALTIPALSIFFYALRYRLLGVVLMSAAVVIDYQIHVAAVDVTFAPSMLSSRASSALYATLMPSTVLVAIGGAVGAAASLLLLALQHSRMRFKQRRLARTVATTQSKLTTAQKETIAAANRQAKTLALCRELLRVVDAIHTARPGMTASARAQESLVWSMAGVASVKGCSLLQSAADVSAALSKKAELAAAAPVSAARLSTQAGVDRWTAPAPSVSVNDVSGEARILLSPRRELPVRSAREQEEFLLQQIEGRAGLSPSSGSAPAAADRPVDALPLRSSVSFAPSLPHVLSHPLTLELFKDHMEAAHCSENVQFLLAVQRFATARSRALRRSLAVSIYHQFIVQGGELQVNLNAALRSQIGQRIAKAKKDAPGDLFAPAYKEICFLIDTNNCTPHHSHVAHRHTPLPLHQRSSLPLSLSLSLAVCAAPCCGWVGKAFVSTPSYALCAAVLLRNAAVVNALQCMGGFDDEDADVESMVSRNDDRSTTATGDEPRGSELMLNSAMDGGGGALPLPGLDEDDPPADVEVDAAALADVDGGADSLLPGTTAESTQRASRIDPV